MMFTPAGRLNQIIGIDLLTGQSQSSTGEVTDVWTRFDDVPAEIKPLHGRNVEIALARTKGKSVSHQVTMRYVPEVHETSARLVFHGRRFEIFSVVNVLEMNRELDVLCNEIVS